MDSLTALFICNVIFNFGVIYLFTNKKIISDLHTQIEFSDFNFDSNPKAVLELNYLNKHFSVLDIKNTEWLFPLINWLKNTTSNYTFLRIVQPSLFIGLTTYLFIDNIIQTKPELFISYIHFMGLSMIVLFIVSPFLKTKKEVNSIAVLKARTNAEYFQSKIYSIASIVLAITYSIASIITDTQIQISTFYVFVHVLIIGLFSERLVEKGSPMNETVKIGSLLNKYILFIQHQRIAFCSVIILATHIIYLIEHSQMNLNDLLHIGLVTVFMLYYGFFCKQKINQTAKSIAKEVN